MAENIAELAEGDELHITIEGDKTLPLTVGGVADDGRRIWLHYDGQEYATLDESGVTNDEYNHTFTTLYSGDDATVGVESIEVV